MRLHNQLAGAVQSLSLGYVNIFLGVSVPKAERSILAGKQLLPRRAVRRSSSPSADRSFARYWRTSSIPRSWLVSAATAKAANFSLTTRTDSHFLVSYAANKLTMTKTDDSGTSVGEACSSTKLRTHIPTDLFSCLICYETFGVDPQQQLVALKCGHMFCAACVHQWFTSNKGAGASRARTTQLPLCSSSVPDVSQAVLAERYSLHRCIHMYRRLRQEENR